MSNVIELQNENGHEINFDVLSKQGVIKLSTDLREEHVQKALLDILKIEGHIDNIESVVDIYLDVLDDIEFDYKSVVQYLQSTNHIDSSNSHHEPYDILNLERIFLCLDYFGGYPAFYDHLGYQIVRNNNQYAIVRDDFNLHYLQDFRNGYHFYMVHEYLDGKRISTTRNVHLRTEDDLDTFVKNQLGFSVDYYLVNNDVTRNKFHSIPRVEKIVNEYQFKPLDEIVENIHLDYIDSIRFVSSDFREITIDAKDISFLEINDSILFNGYFKTMHLENLHLEIKNDDNEKIDLINEIVDSEIIQSTNAVEINYRDGSKQFPYLTAPRYKVTTLSSDRELFAIHLTDDKERFL